MTYSWQDNELLKQIFPPNYLEQSLPRICLGYTVKINPTVSRPIPKSTESAETLEELAQTCISRAASAFKEQQRGRERDVLVLTNIELVVDIGAVLQKGVHHFRVTVLTGCGECRASIL